MTVKQAVFHPKAREAIRTFPAEVRREMGKAIFDLQQGLRIGLPLCREMSSLAPGAAELRIRDSSGAYRAFCFRKSAEGILIFHAFAKKSKKTPQNELVTGRKRLKEMLGWQSGKS